MSNRDAAPETSKVLVWIGWGLTVLFALFMAFDVVIKLIRLPVVEDTLAQLGYPPGFGFGIGVLEAGLLVLYLVPRTALLGAVLFTGLFGGTMATHLRAGSPLFSHILFGPYLAVFAWAGSGCATHDCARCFPFEPDRSFPCRHPRPQTAISSSAV